MTTFAHHAVEVSLLSALSHSVTILLSVRPVEEIGANACLPYQQSLQTLQMDPGEI
jgi:hypothetical protein